MLFRKDESNLMKNIWIMKRMVYSYRQVKITQKEVAEKYLRSLHLNKVDAMVCN